MKTSEILELVRAGFTRDEINQMDNPQNPQDNPQEKQTPVGSDQAGDQDKEQEKQTPAGSEEQPAENKPDSNFKEFADTVKEMIASNKELMKVIQASNLQNDSHGNNSVDDINHQAEDILKSIVAPAKEKEDKNNVR